MKSPTSIIQTVSRSTDTVLLFHSATGKDSIVLLDMLSSNFKKVVCCFMYMVKGISFEEKYIAWAEKKYSNCEFIRMPHFFLSEVVKYGLFGVKKTPHQPLFSLSDIIKEARYATGAEWACLGFKKADSAERAILINDLRTDRETGAVDDSKTGINFKTKVFYPLAYWKNKDCIAYIKSKKLLTPVKFNSDRTQGFVITDGNFLSWLKDKYPIDYEKTIKQFPLIKAYEWQAKAAERGEASL